ncbi:hypothetical protein ARMGADRAFT_1029688 [Armillaria gallica]|uniref:Uncharacterized protein n=1 Tax=Armillaria gallica TaxID=47427 RepID=A0A2H3DF07_ARMGA|nr:hypothetical protein ARMGADRAFT_1029688 [Armillaria gallica]
MDNSEEYSPVGRQEDAVIEETFFVGSIDFQDTERASDDQYIDDGGTRRTGASFPHITVGKKEIENQGHGGDGGSGSKSQTGFSILCAVNTRPIKSISSGSEHAQPSPPKEGIRPSKLLVNTQTRKHANGVRPFVSDQRFSTFRVNKPYPLVRSWFTGHVSSEHITAASALCMRKAAVED